MLKKLIYVLALSLIWSSCTEPKAPDNPFDNLPRDTTAVTSLPDLDPLSIAGLHQDIFKPTCANSGCHDGTFEPDFRTIESSYNTLLFHPIIKNNPAGEFTYRVVPGRANESVLYDRLVKDIDGQSGIMPLALEPDSDWEEKKSEYIQRVQAWIDGGAKDVFGNAATGRDLQPAARGMQAFLPGSTTPLTRENGNRAIIVPGGTPTVEIWFALEDDNTAAFDLGDPKVHFSEQMNDFAGATIENMAIGQARTGESYLGGQADYIHKVSLSLAGIPPGTTLFVRIYVTDPAQSSRTEIPGDGANTYIKRYFSLVIN